MTKTNYDVIVCGGGVAGIAAALASARMGAETCLLEKEYALGGLATLGLIVVYLPLCDGEGVQMSGGITEELLKVSLQYGTGTIPAVWQNSNATPQERKVSRYQVQYNAASFMINAEQLLLQNNVTLFYDARLAEVKTTSDHLTAVTIDTKRGKQDLFAKSFIDATGDADLCYFSGEPTVEDETNRRTGWYFSYDDKDLKLHQQSDPLYSEIPETSRLYSGTKIEDISQHCIDGRKMIFDHVLHQHKNGNPSLYPLLIPTYPGLRMTRRLAGTFEFSEDFHNHVWFSDAIGMIGNWKKSGKRYSIPYRCIKATQHKNLYVAGRCVSADKSGWDLTRVIPTCAVTGEAAGVAAAMQAITGDAPNVPALQTQLITQGVLLRPTLF